MEMVKALLLLGSYMGVKIKVGKLEKGVSTINTN